MPKIPEQGTVYSWQSDLAEDLEVGMGIDWKSGTFVMLFDRYTRLVNFTEPQLREFIAKLAKNAELLKRGTPPGH